MIAGFGGRHGRLGAHRVPRLDGPVRRPPAPGVAAGRAEPVQGQDEHREDQRHTRQDTAHAVRQPLFHRGEFTAGAQLLQVLAAQREAAEERQQGEAGHHEEVAAERPAARGEQSRAGPQQQRRQGGPAHDQHRRRGPRGADRAPPPSPARRTPPPHGTPPPS
ncbi:hypothetical protein GTY75_28540 [Streptomyces sp. SID8381]|uniref:hypothetical protein n=1 Tax=unclassified Streptomyces TaxID=2593676 RepID=UPI000370743D|nr:MULTISPECIES: hypothetical protein [unclassified Streptomyces]MYX30526.1 hypothetical protein [Streptomyces sp. SID8381]